jgi:hypothetical protein
MLVKPYYSFGGCELAAAINPRASLTSNRPCSKAKINKERYLRLRAAVVHDLKPKTTSDWINAKARSIRSSRWRGERDRLEKRPVRGRSPSISYSSVSAIAGVGSGGLE